MSSEILQEELEVLESIYSSEFTKLSENEISIVVEPEESNDAGDEIKLTLNVVYPDGYPDILPLLELVDIEGEFESAEADILMSTMKDVGEENLGTAMTFTLISHMREQLMHLVKARTERRRKEEQEMARRAQEEEDARTRGTPVTQATFMAWKAKFDQEMAIKKAQEEEERLRNLTNKEREEWKKTATRFTGRQQFERDRNLATSDSSLIEEGAVSVDASQYERTRRDDDKEDEQEALLSFSDSD